MRERDEEGRPIATRNAGAFLAPFTGVVPVPSSLVEDSSTKVSDEGEIERRGAQVKAATVASRSDRARWVAAVATSFSVWVLLATGFRLVLLASEGWADTHPVVVGDHMTVLMHTGWFWWVANACFVAIGVKLGLSHAPSGGRRRLAAMVVATVALALAFTLVVEIVGGAAAAMAAGGAVVWLVAAHWIRA